MATLFNRKKKDSSLTYPLAFRKICDLCNLPFVGQHALCDPCIQLFPKINTPCLYCALPLPESQNRICGLCIQHPPQIYQTIIPYPFIEPLRNIIHQFKYHEGLHLSSALSHLIWQHVSLVEKPQLLVPVPIHPKKLKERGFNQSILLTKHLSQWLNLPYDIHLCEKALHTPSQASLSAHTRKINLEYSFKVKKPVSYEHIALVDDVYTTGSTCLSLAAKLLASGAKKVEVWCIARTI